jgi:hypothetical protein
MEKKQRLQLAKYVTNGLCNQLRAVDSPLQKSYINTFFCCSKFYLFVDNLFSSYCKNRWCLTCNRIKTGGLINKYGSALHSMADPFFVTLTIPNVDGCDLDKAIYVMAEAFIRIKDKYRKGGNKITGNWK